MKVFSELHISARYCASSAIWRQKCLRIVCNCTGDEGGPLGAVLQEEAPNRLKLLCPKGQGGER